MYLLVYFVNEGTGEEVEEEVDDAGCGNGVAGYLNEWGKEVVDAGGFVVEVVEVGEVALGDA